MNVDLSPGTVQKAEQLVLSGEYPDVDSAIAAALDILSCSACTDETYDPLDDEADADIAAGRTRTVDDAYLAELRQKAQAIIASKRHA